MKTFFTRTLSGAIYAAIIIGSILAGPVVFGLTMFVFLLFSTFEFHRILQVNDNAPSLLYLLLSSSLIYLTGYLVIVSVLPDRAFGIVLLVLFLFVLIQFFQNSEMVIQKTGMMLLGLIYLAVPLFLLNLLFYRDFSFDVPVPDILIGLFIITWFNDTFAYFVGSLIGKHKLAQRISPNKSWEGSAGGFVFSLVGAYLLSLVFPDTEFLQWLILTAIIVVFGTFGDLFESVLKRNAGIKESGTLIPGHGGILDRLDSILIATPFVFTYLYFFLS